MRIANQKRALSLGAVVATALCLCSTGAVVAQEGWAASSERLAERLRVLMEDVERGMQEATGETVVPGRGPRVGEIDEMIAMQRRLRIMELRQREAQIIAELATALRRAQQQLVPEESAPPQPASVPPPVQAATPNQSQDRNEYRVLSLSGSGGNLRAVVWSSRFGRLNVAPGVRLPDGTLVSRVEMDGIWVRRPGEVEDIPLGQGSETASSATLPVMNIGQPPGAISPPVIPPPSVRPPTLPPAFPSPPGADGPPRRGGALPGGSLGLGGEEPTSSGGRPMSPPSAR